MTNEKIFYLIGICLFALVSLNVIYAGVIDNELQNIPESYMYNGVKIYQNERECTLVGGLCVHSNDCLEPSTKKGLCPSNKHRGIECCYAVPLRPAPCHDHWGACMTWCNEKLRRPGTDCTNGQVCCVLVNK